MYYFLFKAKFYLRRIVYFFLFLFVLWFVIFANYGVVDYFKYQHQIKTLQSEISILKTEREFLLKQVRSMSSTIDLNLLEMQVRNVLFYARQEEEIYFWK